MSKNHGVSIEVHCLQNKTKFTRSLKKQISRKANYFERKWLAYITVDLLKL